jgi:AraC-like DNA-binding protein
MTERPDSLLDHPRREPAPAGAPGDASGVDPLSDVLQTVRLTGAVFFLVSASRSWGGTIPDGMTIAPALLPRTQQIISYHVMLEGTCWGGLVGEPPVLLEKGDVLVLPHGDAYVMAVDPKATRPEYGQEATLEFLRGVATGRFPSVIAEPGVTCAQVACGFLGCDVQPFNPLLTTLPRLLVVRRACRPGAGRLDALLELTLTEAAERRPGGDSVRLRLSELIFVEVVRHHLTTLSEQDSGWLGGLRDPLVGRALSLLHARPAETWTLQVLAERAGTSRSVLADRFSRLVGEPPMQYLARWRMQLAARLLADGAEKVSAVAQEVGYDSEAAFSRAFKKMTGVPPAAWRDRRVA